MAAIDTAHVRDLERLMAEARRAARTVRAGTRAERELVCRMLAVAVRRDLEPHARLDEAGLVAVRTWLAALEAADSGRVDILQELLYGLDALVRVHVWRETGLPLVPPDPAPESRWEVES